MLWQLTYIQAAHLPGCYQTITNAKKYISAQHYESLLSLASGNWLIMHYYGKEDCSSTVEKIVDASRGNKYSEQQHIGELGYAVLKIWDR